AEREVPPGELLSRYRVDCAFLCPAGRMMPADVNGYVLAGGKSSRMGRDKAMLELAGKPLVQRAVEKLRRVCAEVFVVGNRPELEAYAPVVQDLHEECGPLGGIEAALLRSDR